MAQFDDGIRGRIAALVRAMNVTRYFKEDKVPCQMEQGLFLGSVGAAGNKDELKRLNITHILTVANSLAPMHPNDFVYKVVGVADREDTNLRQHFDECFNFIDEAKRQGGVLVHCFVGKSRSVTIIVAYLMKRRGMSLSQALEHVKSRRPLADPNSGFISQLQDFEKSLQGANNKDALKSSNVTHILTVADMSVCTYPNDFVYKEIAVMDREDINIAQYFDECFNFIDEAKSLGGSVLVHCFMGISRSVTIVVAYLMKKHYMNLSQALEHVKSRRPQAAPNSGFISQLQHFKESLQGAS